MQRYDFFFDCRRFFCVMTILCSLICCFFVICVVFAASPLRNDEKNVSLQIVFVFYL